MHGWMRHTAPFRQELFRERQDEKDRVLRLIRQLQQRVRASEASPGPAASQTLALAAGLAAS